MFADECAREIDFLSCFAQSGCTSKNKSTSSRGEVGNLKCQSPKQIFTAVAFYGFIVDLNNKQRVIRNQGAAFAAGDGD